MKTWAVAASIAFLAFASTVAGPNRYGHGDRVERHLLPAVSTGPQDPEWSPDGEWIAFSMRGDIWKISPRGGVARALTSGPAYHFEPTWSPDGSQLALSYDTGGNLDIGIIDESGGEVRRITTHRQVDIAPEWSRDGKSLFFVSARRGGFQIYRHDLATGENTEVVRGIQPAVSPDGSQLAFVAGVQGRLGTGGLWKMSLPDGEPTLVLYEETEYRMKPAWTPDGSAFLYVSDEMGSNDVATIPATGGNPITITAHSGHEFSPTPSPDGERFAFVSNYAGPTTLCIAPIGGGPFASWRTVASMLRIWPSPPHGRLKVTVLGLDGTPTPARIHLKASDGRAYTPDGGFHRVNSSTETHYFHTDGTFEIELPSGKVTVEAMKGYEFKPISVEVEVAPSTESRETVVTIPLQRIIDLPALGWYSGDTHIHDLHQGRFGQSYEAFFNQLVAEDLHVTNALIHMDGTRLMGRWEDLTGSPHELSTDEHILQYAEEFRGSLGHIALLGITNYVLPFTGGGRNTSYAAPAPDWTYIDAARAQGGIAGFVHPFNRAVTTPAGAANSLIPVDAALGRGDFYDICANVSDELSSAEFYYKLLNCGFRIAATAGTDNFSDVYRDPPPGSDRTYVKIDGELSVKSWLEGVKAGRTFGSTGPLLVLNVDSQDPGAEINVGQGFDGKVRVTVNARSIAPMARLDIIANGRVAASVQASDPLYITFSGEIDLPEGGWIAARVIGPSSRFISDSYAFAQTSPVYVVRDDKPWTSAEDAKFLAESVEAMWSRVDGRGGWRSDADREEFRAGVDVALSVYRKIAGG